MKKIPTLFVVNYRCKGSKGEVTTQVHPKSQWVYEEEGVIATQKFDGTAVLVQEGKLYKRYDVKPTKEAFKRHVAGDFWKLEDFKQVPSNAIRCQEPDLVTGHFPHWLPCELGKPEDRYFWEAFNKQKVWVDGTYELCGEKVGINPEKVTGHSLIKHGSVIVELPDFSFKTVKDFLINPANDLEGLVLYGKEGKMCKIRKSDFSVIR